MIAVLIPVLNRPERVKPLIESLAAASRFTDCEALFLCSPGDKEQVRALADVTPSEADFVYSWEIMNWEAGPGDYAKKINWGIRDMVGHGVEFEFVLLGADDLRFHPGWAERALACHQETHACVIGTNDLGNPQVTRGDHSTHSLVHRDYLECGTWDEPGKILHEGYDHSFSDTEFVETAKARETWAHATDSIVEHLHPSWGKGKRDATYDRGQEGFARDRELFRARRKMWEAEL